MTKNRNIVEVAVPLPIPKTFAYEVSPGTTTPVLPGQRVLVPFGRRTLCGIVLGPATAIPPGVKVLPIQRILDDEFSLSGKFLAFLLWVARYYMQPVGEVLKTALPSGIALYPQEVYSLTELGVKELSSSSLSGEEARILRALRRRGGLGSCPKSLTASPSFPASLENLIHQGMIRRDDDILESKMKGKFLSYLTYVEKNGEGNTHLTARQKEALDLIRQNGEIPLLEFNGKYKFSPSILSKLKKLNLIEIIQKEVFRQPNWEETDDWMDGPPLLLMEDQKKAIDEISRAIHQKGYRPFLLFGVTGSGKTEVYLRVIEEVIAQGRQAMILVPEIALTAQMVAYFRSRIHYPLAVLHSGLSEGERYDEWRRIKRNLVKLVIGARSAIFAPLASLGIIIVDEEHDPSYKQEEKVRYHARDLALMRGKMEGAVVVLGSATPSLESYYNTVEKKIQLLKLPSRIDHRPLAPVQVVDMRKEK
jgi:primosomal protein N' (replication factor Y)